MLRQILNLIGTKGREAQTANMQEIKTGPYKIRVSVPILSGQGDQEEFTGEREEFLIDSEENQLSFSRVLDATCQFDGNHNSSTLWRIENAMDTVLSVPAKDRKIFSSKIDKNGISCPVRMKIRNGETVSSIQLSLDDDSAEKED